VQKKIRTFRIKTSQKEEAYNNVSIFGVDSISCESDGIIADMEDSVTPTQLAEYLRENDVAFESIDIIAETERELRRTIMEYEED
jgi:hypothetical protein